MNPAIFGKIWQHSATYGKYALLKKVEKQEGDIIEF